MEKLIPSSKEASKPERRTSCMTIGLLAALFIIIFMWMLWMTAKQSDVELLCKTRLMVLKLSGALCSNCPECAENGTQYQEPCPTCPKCTHSELEDVPWRSDWDRMSPAKKATPAGAARILVLVRHGKYNSNTGLLVNDGKIQVNLTAQRLKSLFPTFDEIFSSPIKRAQESAAILRTVYPGVKHTPNDKRLLEGAVPTEPIIDSYKMSKRAFFLEEPRLETAFRSIFHRPKKAWKKPRFELYIGHGNIFRIFLLKALQLPPQAWMRVFLPNASITQIKITPSGEVILERFGEANHLPPNLVTL